MFSDFNKLFIHRHYINSLVLIYKLISKQKTNSYHFAFYIQAILVQILLGVSTATSSQYLGVNCEPIV
jgi:hypothetical protein